MSRNTLLATSTVLAAWGCHAAYLTHRLRQSRLDPLTGLCRRDEFTRRSRRLLYHAPDAAVMLLDLDGFKQINDSLGHEVGDVLLAVSADRIRTAVPEAVVGRLGGDEFVATTPSRPRQLSALDDALTKPVLHQHGVTTPAISLGLAPDAARTGLPEALRRADSAMYSVKAAGGGTAMFDAISHSPAHGRARQIVA